MLTDRSQFCECSCKKHKSRNKCNTPDVSKQHQVELCNQGVNRPTTLSKQCGHQLSGMFANRLTLNTLLDTLKKDIHNPIVASIIAKMVSTIVKKQSNAEDIQTTIKILANANVINILTTAMVIHSQYPPIQAECQLAVSELIQTLVKSRIEPENCFAATEQKGVNDKDTATKHKSKHMCGDYSKVYSKPDDDSCYFCNWCGKRFERKANYSEHTLVHRVEAPFQCKICYKQSKQRNRLQKHIKIHM